MSSQQHPNHASPDDDSQNSREFSSASQYQDYEQNGSRMTPSRMAGMLHFEEGEGKFGEVNADIAAAGSEYEEDDPIQVKTKRGLESNPLAKMGLIGGVGLLVFAILATIVSGVFFRSRQTAIAPNIPPTPRPNVPGEFRDPKGDYETELALARQQRELEALQNRKPNKLERKEPKAQPVTIVQPTPQPVAPPPRPIVREVARPAPVRPAPAPAPAPRPLPQPSPTQDPAEAWLAASLAGSAGQISPPEEVQSNDADQTQQAVDSGQETSILTGQKQPKPAQLISGTRAKGILATPVAWGAGNAQNEGAGVDRFIVTLNEPLKAADGSAALPPGTQLVTQLNSYSQDGLIDLSVVSAVVTTGGQQQEIPISGGTIKIGGKQGEPLIAKMTTRGNTGGGFTTALRQGLLGAAKGATEELTKADTSTSTSTSGGQTSTATTVSSGDRNLAAGLVKGGSTALLDSFSARTANQSRQQPARIWFAKAGTQVEVFVTQPTEIPRLTASLGSNLSGVVLNHDRIATLLNRHRSFDS
jgi:hypothetical protein